MAKKPAAGTQRRARQAVAWSGERRDTSIDNMFSAARDAAAVQLQRDDITVGTEAERLFIGLPFPALCLRYVFQSTVFPLGRVLQIAGEEGSCKSALLYEVFRWHMTYGGGAVLMENEAKDAAVMRDAILQRNDMWLNRMTVIPTSSVQDWQKALTYNMRNFRVAMEEKGGPGRTIPICLGIDSLTATDVAEEIAKTAKEGSAALGFARQAGLIARYMRQAVVGNIRGWPFTIAGTNHMKPATDSMGRPVKNVPGGKAVPFMATFLIEMSRIKDIDLADYGGVRLKIKMGKCSVGPSRKSIEAEFLWWQSPQPDGTILQDFCWDWDTATVETLLRFQMINGKKTLFNNLMDICDLRVVSKTGKLVWSKTLGIPKDNPVEYRVAGAALERRPDLLEQMYPLLGISRGSHFQPGLDYLQMIADAKSHGATESALLYGNRENLPTVTGDDVDPASMLEDDEEEETEVEAEAPE
jgi:RecA/RadA recombinase